MVKPEKTFLIEFAVMFVLNETGAAAAAAAFFPCLKLGVRSFSHRHNFLEFVTYINLAFNFEETTY